jgi:hypothetical protein
LLGEGATFLWILGDKTMKPREGYYWFRSDDEAHRMLYSQREDGWEIVRVYETKKGWRAIMSQATPLLSDLLGEWSGPIQPSIPIFDTFEGLEK